MAKEKKEAPEKTLVKKSDAIGEAVYSMEILKESFPELSTILNPCISELTGIQNSLNHSIENEE